jgi:hypothetical protein
VILRLILDLRREHLVAIGLGRAHVAVAGDGAAEGVGDGERTHGVGVGRGARRGEAQVQHVRVRGVAAHRVVDRGVLGDGLLGVQRQGEQRGEGGENDETAHEAPRWGRLVDDWSV